MAKKKADTAEVAKRVDEVLRIRLDGAQRHDILQYASENGWGLTDRQVGEYIRRADNLLVERRDTKRKRVIALHIARREALYARAVNSGDHRAALAILDSQAKIQGLYLSERELRELTAAQRERLRQLESQPDVSREELKAIARQAAKEALAAEPEEVEIVPPPGSGLE
jgi:hypothetical protein